LLEVADLLFGELVVADDGAHADEVLALHERLEGSLADEAGGELGVVEDVGNVLVPQRVVDWNRREPKQVRSDVSQRPLSAVLRKDSEHFQLLAFRHIKKPLTNYSAADLMRALESLLVGDKLDGGGSLLVLDDLSWIRPLVPSAGRLANFLQLLMSMSFMVAKCGSSLS
jgi:hypothetical protein